MIICKCSNKRFYHCRCFGRKVDFQLVSLPGNVSFREDLSFTPDVFKFFSMRDLRDAWADRRKILHGGQY